MTIAKAQKNLGLSQQFLAKIDELAQNFPTNKVEIYVFLGDVFCFESEKMTKAAHNLAKEFAESVGADFLAVNAAGTEWAFRFKDQINEDGMDWSYKQDFSSELDPQTKQPCKTSTTKPRWLSYRGFVKSL